MEKKEKKVSFSLAVLLSVLFFLTACLLSCVNRTTGSASRISAKSGTASIDSASTGPGSSDLYGEGADLLSLEGKIGNSARIISRIREGLRVHSAAITVSFDYGSDIFPELNSVIESWMEAALAETDAADEGDYLRYQMGGYTYKSTSTRAGGRWQYSVRIVPSYYCYLTQEEEAGEAVRRIRRSFHFFPWTSREKKISVIYAYLCGSVHYDSVHRKNPYYHTCSTAYAALVQGRATCQGYCTALYRLLREEGIACRIVTGTAGEEELHAWLLAELDGAWYLLDPTWDAGREEYGYFLLGKEESADHLPGSDFLTEDFLQSCPMAEKAWKTRADAKRSTDQ